MMQKQELTAIKERVSTLSLTEQQKIQLYLNTLNGIARGC